MIKNTRASTKLSSGFINKLNEANRPASDSMSLNHFELWSSKGAPLVNQDLTEYSNLYPIDKYNLQNLLPDISDKGTTDAVDLDTAVSSLKFLQKAVSNATSREYQLDSSQGRDDTLASIQGDVRKIKSVFVPDE